MRKLTLLRIHTVHDRQPELTVAIDMSRGTVVIDDVSRGTDAAATTDTLDAAKEAAPSAFNENGDNNQSETSQTTIHMNLLPQT